MPCILAILALAFPRFVLVLLFLFSNYLGRAYHGFLIPLLGFIFVPVTTIVYAWIVNRHAPVAGGYLVLLVVAVVIDLGSWDSGRRSRRG